MTATDKTNEVAVRVFAWLTCAAFRIGWKSVSRWAFGQMRYAIERRTPEQVARMEQARGLA